MNRNFALLAVSLLSLTAASAAIASPQQEKMKACNAEAKGKSGDERKAFMKECLSAKKEDVKSAKTTQQEKMKACNAEAKTKALSGDERKQFMSSCLSN
ncbi:MAG: phosphate starvation-inducible protein PsiF [Rhodocyclales bacterium]|jgi:hypothetical protein|nr:phosphate starvation-inducible protein PsiF [Rhodocyclales bacterium]